MAKEQFNYVELVDTEYTLKEEQMGMSVHLVFISVPVNL